MARIYNGILGGIQGKVGDVNGYYYKDIPVIRAKRRKNKKAVTSIPQLAALQRMKLTNTFMKSISNFVNIGFGLTAAGQKSNGYNAAKAYIIKNVFIGDYPDQLLDYSKVRLAEGSLPEAVNPQAVVTESGIKFTWEVPENRDYEENRSEVMVLVYVPELNRSEYMISGVRRTEGVQNLPLRDEFRGHALHTYIAFISDDRKKISNSTYTGEVSF